MDERMADLNRTQILSGDPNRTQMGAPPVADPNKTMMGSAPSLNATQTIKPVQCPVCKTFNPTGVMFCVECGLIFDRALPGDAFGAPAIQLPMLIDSNGREHLIRPGTNVVGREADIQLPDARVSRRHAQITFDANEVLSIEDLGSTNGTKVNGNALAAGQSQTLAGGEKLSFGGLELQLQLPGAKGGNTTQVFASNKTAAIAAAPKKDVTPGRLKGGDYDLPLKQGINTFGRKADNDVCIPDPYVSGKHGTIELTDAGVYITDIGSSNGTVLSGAKLVPNMRTLVRPDDEIQLGSVRLTVEVSPQP